MELNINELIKLKGSDDFEFVRSILIRLKTYAENCNNELFLQQYIKKFLHYRLFMKTEYICDTSFFIDDFKDHEILKNIVKKAIDRILFYFDDKYKSINEVDMTNNCVVASFEIKKICDELGIACKVVTIYPGYEKDARLFGLSGFHYFNIVTIKDKNYLVDISYKQFFKKNTNFLEEIGIPYLCAPLAGSFMLMNKEHQKFADELLKNGFIELKDDALKLYCDGFTMSYRNSLYYEYFGKDYYTNYTNENYIDFLFGDDSQLKHEPVECLGPLKYRQK